MLVQLPPELLCQVYQLLPHASVNQLSLTCRSLHASALPTLYTTVVLSFRTHIRQLETGLQKDDGILKHILQHHTKEIVLKCKRSGHHGLLFDSRSLLSQLPHVRSLSLVGFDMLPVDYITPMLSLLPHLDSVSLRYCDLIADLPSIAGLSNRVNMPTSQHGKVMHRRSHSVTTLEFHWTNFTKEAMDSILSRFPSLTKVRLLANHNRHFLANNYALGAIKNHCLQITDLEVGLQEVKEKELVDCIMFYGTQLQRLSIRYHSPLTLFAVTKYASSLKDLTVRFPMETTWSSSSTLPPPASAPRQRLPRLPYTTARSHSHQQQEVEQEIQRKGTLFSVLDQCHCLVRMQIESMRPSQSRDSLPLVIRNALETVAQKRITLNNGGAHSFKNVLRNDDDNKYFTRDHHHGIRKPTNSNCDAAYNDAKMIALSRNPSTTNDMTSMNKYQKEEKDNGNDNNGTPGSQQHRKRKDLSSQMQVDLVLDNEQLKEIRSQALPYV